jgi:hypothetical protein
MRNAQFPFSQTKMAFLEDGASLAEKYQFRGICFILSLQWLELKNCGKSDSASILALKEKGRFLALWKDFTHQSQQAHHLKEMIEQEVELASGQIAAYGIAILDTKKAINSLKSDQIDEHIQQVASLQALRKKQKELINLQTGGKGQLKRMFASEAEQASGEPGTPSEQILRKMFGMNVKMITVEPLTLKEKGNFFKSDKMSWEDAGSAVAKFISALTVKTPGLFEIGFYGSGAHSVAVYVDRDGAYAFFDPNYGIFAGPSNKLDADIANLLKDQYPKMDKVVVSWIEITG